MTVPPALSCKEERGPKEEQRVRSGLMIPYRVSEHTENPLEADSPGLLCETVITLMPKYQRKTL